MPSWPAARAGHLYSCPPPPMATGVKKHRGQSRGVRAQQRHDRVPSLSPNHHQVRQRRNGKISPDKVQCQKQNLYPPCNVRSRSCPVASGRLAKPARRQPAPPLCTLGRRVYKATLGPPSGGQFDQSEDLGKLLLPLATQLEERL